MQYKPFLVFLAKFFVTYAVLSAIYYLWLGQFDNRRSPVDTMTEITASHSAAILRLFDADVILSAPPATPWIKLLYNGKYVARIIEGCNAVSIMILFIAFIVAFTGKVRATVFFAIFGCLVIYILNILRIAFLSSAIYHYPQHEHFLHTIVFPLIIYGVVFLLWVIWVNKFSVYAKRDK